jgi:hypothetical protein
MQANIIPLLSADIQQQKGPTMWQALKYDIIL